MTRALLLAFALLLAWAQTALAQAETGDRVRATLIAKPQTRVVGTLLSYRPESITLAAEPDFAESTLARPSIKRLEVSEGMRSNIGRGAVFGAIGGFLVLGSIAAAEVQSEHDSPYPWYVVGPVYGAIGAVAGAGVGAVIGAFSKHEKWERVRVPR